MTTRKEGSTREAPTAELVPSPLEEIVRGRQAATPVPANGSAANALHEHELAPSLVNGRPLHRYFDLGLIAAGVFGILVITGWLYLTAYYSLFKIPSGGLDINLAEILAEGAHALVFPMAGALAAIFLRSIARQHVQRAALAIGAVALGLALIASLIHWYSTLDVAVQTAAVLWLGMTGLTFFGGSAPTGIWQRLVVAATALLLLLSLPIALGTVDANQRARVTQSHLVLVSNHELGMPGGVKTGGVVQYKGYVLIRETPGRIWIIRAGHPGEVYSVSKGEVLVRY